jgi:large subunit ribosomal protein L18e
MAKQNPRMVRLIDELERRASEDDVGVWDEVAARLDGPSQNHAEVNVGTIERYADDGDVVVPGKVLGSGVITKDVTVAAVDFSSGARDKIARADGAAVALDDYLDDNPDGSDVQVIR